MTEDQLAFYKGQIERQILELEERLNSQASQAIATDTNEMADEIDRASVEEARRLELEPHRARQAASAQAEGALKRINEGISATANPAATDLPQAAAGAARVPLLRRVSEHQGIQRYPRVPPRRLMLRQTPSRLGCSPQARGRVASGEPGPTSTASRKSVTTSSVRLRAGPDSTGDQSVKWLIRLCLCLPLLAQAQTSPSRSPADRSTTSTASTSSSCWIWPHPCRTAHKLERVDLNLNQYSLQQALARARPSMCSGWEPPAPSNPPPDRRPHSALSRAGRAAALLHPRRCPGEVQPGQHPGGSPSS